ncbi:hypothetical protein ACFV0Q_39625, partial [Streptomyces sp. NPDC059564]
PSTAPVHRPPDHGSTAAYGVPGAVPTSARGAAEHGAQPGTGHGCTAAYGTPGHVPRPLPTTDGGAAGNSTRPGAGRGSTAPAYGTPGHVPRDGTGHGPRI